MRSALSLLVVLAMATACNKIVDEDGDGFDVEFDCDDSDIQVHPGAAEVCDGVDNDCDGEVDEDASGGAAFFLDSDGDGFGTMAEVVIACEAPEGYVIAAGDCDDSSAAIKPGAQEVCDGIDNDCDGVADDDATDASNWYADWDGDGWGSDITHVMACEQPEAYLDTSGDCNDFDAEANPDAVEVCDWVDNDCDGVVDGPDTEGAVEWYADNDGDGFGVAETTVMACFKPDGYTDNTDDCDDGNWQVSPDAEEICGNGIDDNCDESPAPCGVRGTYAADEADSILSGANTSDYTGVSIAFADLNGDGTDDLLIGADGHDDPNSSGGAVYVNYGPLSGDYDLGRDYDAKIYGASLDYLGEVVANLGDLNGDGYDDVGALSDYYSNESWYVAYGTSSLITGDIEVSYLGGAYITTSSYDQEDSYDIAGVGDVNGDGYDDFAVGDRWWDEAAYDAGAVFLYYGSATAMSGSYDYASQARWLGESSDDYGYTMAGGDLDADGYSDLLATSLDGNYVSLVYGSSTDFSGAYSVSSDAEALFLLNGSSNFDYAAVDAGDVDGDGYEDVLIGHSDQGNGEVWLVLGGSTRFGGDVSLAADADVLITGNASYDDLGGDATLGDLDGDGKADLLLGADEEDTAATSAGAVYVFYAPTAGEWEAADADAFITGVNSYDYFGRQIEVGDADGDGIMDMAVGVSNYDPEYGGGSTYSSGGGTFVFFGGGM